MFPPNLKHAYFEHGKDHPFRPRSRKFELVNAWWLAESSLLAYADPGFATPAFTQVNTYRIVHHRDIVTRVPPVGPYKADKTRVGRYYALKVWNAYVSDL